jgi:hypothetical protein
MNPPRKSTFDPAVVLQVVSDARAVFDAALSDEERAAMQARAADDRSADVLYSIDQREQAMSEFGTLAAADALQALADDVQAHAGRLMEELQQKALEVYYTAEELAKDPANAELIPHVENMRRAYEAQHGRPIPPKATK